MPEIELSVGMIEYEDTGPISYSVPGNSVA